MNSPRLSSIAALGVLLLAGCGAGSAHQSVSTRLAGTPASGASSVPGTPASSAATRPGSSSAAKGVPKTPGSAGVPRFNHIVIVVLENKPYGELTGTAGTPFLTALAASGALLNQSYAITHPSEPNYLALFSGSTQGLTSDSCPNQFTGPNLGAALLASGRTFTGFSESLPAVGFTGCSSGAYARKHNPWVDFELPASVNQPMTAFPSDFNKLPDLAFVIPNLDNDMHDGSIAEGDGWLATHLTDYALWMTAHNSLLIVTTDEDDKSADNHITTIIAGARVRPNPVDNRVNHYTILRTLLASFSIAPFGGAASVPPLTGLWAS